MGFLDNSSVTVDYPYQGEENYSRNRDKFSITQFA